MSHQEKAKAGVVERATVEIMTPHLSDGWYWYHGEPIYVFDGVARGYNFTTKEEWRRTDIEQSELRPCK